MRFVIRPIYTRFVIRGIYTRFVIRLDLLYEGILGSGYPYVCMRLYVCGRGTYIDQVNRLFSAVSITLISYKQK